MPVLVPSTTHHLGRRCADDEHATTPPSARAPRGDRARALPLVWAGPAKFAMGPSQHAEASGEMEARFYSSLFNFQKTYLGLNTLGNSFKLQKFIINCAKLKKYEINCRGILRS
jgi:hypothetical protein